MGKDTVIYTTGQVHKTYNKSSVSCGKGNRSSRCLSMAFYILKFWVITDCSCLPLILETVPAASIYTFHRNWIQYKWHTSSKNMQERHRVCTAKCWTILYRIIQVSAEYSKSTIALGTVGIASHSIVLCLIIQLGLSPAPCSLCSHHFDMLRSFEAAVGELGPASVPDFNFNSLKEHAVLCCDWATELWIPKKPKYIPMVSWSLAKSESATSLPSTE